MEKKLLAITIAGMFLPLNVSAESCNSSSAQKTSFYFSTGVNTTPASTKAWATKLSNVYKASLESSAANTEVAFFPANNPTQGIGTDVVQVLKQKMIEEGVDNSGISAYQLLTLLPHYERSELLDVFALLTLNPLDDLVLSFTDDVLDELQEAIADSTAQATADLSNTSSNHVSTYEADLLAGKRVLILAHSQGNLFTNDSVQTVSQRQPELASSIGFYGVATPAGSHYNNADYVTAHDDRVIDALRLIENVLPSNIDNDPGILGDNRDFWTNHYFGPSYFDDSLPSRNRIDQGVTNLFNTLEYPTALGAEGALRATLTWGSQPDMDLHVFEPDGTQIYYRNLRGAIGTLDHDDTSSFGPENYVVSCDAVSEGQYRVGVNYYSGSAPETATINLFVSDGQSVTPRSVTINSESGSSGNSSPTILFTVNASRDTNNELRFQIE